MRILFWTEQFWPAIGGAEIFSTKLLPALQTRGYEPIVVTDQTSPDLPTEAQYKGIPVYRLPFRTVLADRKVEQILAMRRQVAELKQTFAPDLVHMHGITFSAFFCLETIHTHPAPLLVTLINETPLEQTIDRGLWRRVLSTATWVTGKAIAVLSLAHQLMPDITPRSSVIYNGLKVSSLSPEPLPFETPRLLCVGRLMVQKGVDLALTALAAIRDRFPNLRLLIAGDGIERAALERQTSALNLAEVVDFIGWIAPAQVLTLINTATIVVMPSRWEGHPSVALQAGLMARPVVATRVGGLPEIIVHEQTGLLVEKEDVAGLADALSFLLEHPEKATQMGQAARQRVQEVFSWEQCVSAYATLYRQLITESRPGGLSDRIPPITKR